MEQEDDDSDADSAITPNSDRNATRAARRKAKPLAIRKNGKLDKGKAVAGMSITYRCTCVKIVLTRALGFSAIATGRFEMEDHEWMAV